MAPTSAGARAFGHRGCSWGKEWNIIGNTLPPNVDPEGALKTPYYEVIVLAECHVCNVKNQQLEASPLDLRTLGTIHAKDRTLAESENVMRLPLLCHCRNATGRPRRPVGIRAIVAKAMQMGTFTFDCMAQCFNCQHQVQPFPPLRNLGQHLGKYRQLLAVECCQDPKVKVTALRMHFAPNLDQIRPTNLVIELPCPAVVRPEPKVCGVCCEPIEEDKVSCRDCPMAYHAECQRAWLARRRHLMAPKCLYCFSPLTSERLDTLMDVNDVYIHANSLNAESLESLRCLLPGVRDHLVRRPKSNPKDAVRRSGGQPPLFLAWYRFDSEQSRNTAYNTACLNGWRRLLNLRRLSKGDNKLRSHRKFGEVLGN